jgi:hypothetical protein
MIGNKIRSLQYDIFMYMKDDKAKNVEDKIVYLIPFALLTSPGQDININGLQERSD